MIDKKFWRREWTDQEAKDIESQVSKYVRMGAINERAAWCRAELDYYNQVSPFMRNKHVKDRKKQT